MSLAPPPAGRADWALFLDLDGTLAPLCPHPDDVEVPTARSSALPNGSRPRTQSCTGLVAEAKARGGHSTNGANL